MPFSKNPKIDPDIAAQEIPLLRQGLTITEISRQTGHPRSSIDGRNKHVYKIDTFQAYLDRITREGIPNRLNVSDDFGHWLSGFFDGEGCFLFYSHQAKGHKARSYWTGIQLSLRDDDLPILKTIASKLDVGYIRDYSPSPGKPQKYWICHKVLDLAEVIIPLFDRFPLRAKKAIEYPIWRAGVIHRYTWSVGGKSRRRISAEHRVLYDEIESLLKRVKQYHSPPLQSIPTAP